MKEKILQLRKNRFTYNEIVEKLGCSKSTVSYHCKKNNLNKPIFKNKKIDEKIIKKIESDSLTLTIKEIAIKYNISESSVKKYSLPKYKKNVKKCKNCDIIINNNMFCSLECSSPIHYLGKKKVTWF